MDDTFETDFSIDELKLLMDLGAELGFDPLGSSETESFFRNLLDRFSEERIKLKDWLRNEISGHLKCVGKRPEWIQGPAWPFTSQGPLVFIGQIDILPGLFHDAASFYTFHDPKTGVTRTILQVA